VKLLSGARFYHVSRPACLEQSILHYLRVQETAAFLQKLLNPLYRPSGWHKFYDRGPVFDCSAFMFLFSWANRFVSSENCRLHVGLSKNRVTLFNNVQTQIAIFAQKKCNNKTPEKSNKSYFEKIPIRGFNFLRCQFSAKRYFRLELLKTIRKDLRLETVKPSTHSSHLIRGHRFRQRGVPRRV